MEKDKAKEILKQKLIKKDPSLASVFALQDLTEKISMAKGERGDVGPRGPEGPKGDKGEKGDFVAGPQGIKGEKGDKGDRGDKGDSIVGPAGKDGENGKNGSPDSPEQIADKLNSLEEAIEPTVIKGMITVKDVIAELKKRQHLEPKNIKGMPLNMNDLRWHGGGATKISLLEDVSISNLQNNDNLVYNSTSKKWENKQDPTQYWQRVSTTLSPVNTGDNVLTTGKGTFGTVELTAQSNDLKLGNYYIIASAQPGFTFSLGYAAGLGATNATYGNILGYQAGYNATNATHVNFLGYQAGSGANAASYSNFLGYNAGNGATSATYSNFFGHSAGLNATDAISSNFFGTDSGKNATYATYSNFVGNGAGNGATNASYCNYFGRDAGKDATAADASNFIGSYSGAGATNASSSNFIGNFSGNSAVNAVGSQFFGLNAGYGATNAEYSNFIGMSSGSGATGSSYSIFSGFYSGYGATAASHSVFIGTNSGNVNDSNDSTFVNNLIIDQGVISTGGSRATAALIQTNALLYGTFADTSAGQQLTVNGQLNVNGGIFASGDISTTNFTGSSAVGLDLQHTLTATGNDHDLIGVYISPTFVDGGYSNINKYSLYVNGNGSNYALYTEKTSDYQVLLGRDGSGSIATFNGLIEGHTLNICDGTYALSTNNNVQFSSIYGGDGVLSIGTTLRRLYASDGSTVCADWASSTAPTFGVQGIVDIGGYGNTRINYLQGDYDTLIYGDTGLMATFDAGAMALLLNTKITTYNNVATEGYGIPAIVDRVGLTGQTADITATNLTNTNVAGEYRISYYLMDTTSDATAGVLTLTFSFTDAVGATTKTDTVNLTATGRTSGVFYVRNAGANYITYATTHTGIYGTSQYALYFICERVN